MCVREECPLKARVKFAHVKCQGRGQNSHWSVGVYYHVIYFQVYVMLVYKELMVT